MTETVIYRGRRYDVSAWVPRHPGGEIIQRFLGRDVTCLLNMFHDVESRPIKTLLERMDMGPAEEHPTSAFDLDYLALQETFQSRGWFEVSPGYYAYKIGCVLAFLGAAFWLSHPILKGVCFGLFIQQGAFIAHDACHGSVFPRRFRKLGAWLFTDVCFGISHEHWTSDHNAHHLLVNRPAEDPQINNMPDLVYSAPEIELFEQTRRPLGDGEKFRMATQHLWFVPVLLLYGRINLLRGYLQKGWRNRDWQYLSAAGLHLGMWALLTAQCSGSLSAAAIFLATALSVSGIIHIQLLLSHIYAPRLMEDEQHELGMKIQAVSNQNITTTFLDDWLHGGLQHHIEHHLFPRLPRHNLARARPEVRALCEKHSLPYRSDPALVCLRDLLGSLQSASAPLRRDLWNRFRSRGLS